MKPMKTVNRLSLDPRETLRVVATRGYRKASKELRCSRGKLFDIRKANPGLYEEFRAKKEAKSPGQPQMTALTKTDGGIPAIWRQAAECRRRLVRHGQQDAWLKVQFGHALLHAKAHVSHGQWLPELKVYCEWHARSAERFMRVAEKCVPATHLKFDNLSNLALEPLPDEVEALIREAINGRSFSRLYKDLFPGSAAKAKDKTEPVLPAETAPGEALGKPSGTPPAAEPQPAVAAPVLNSAPPNEIADLIHRVREFAQGHPEASSEAAKVELSLQQVLQRAQIAVAAAHELLAYAGDHNGASHAITSDLGAGKLDSGASLLSGQADLDAADATGAQMVREEVRDGFTQPSNCVTGERIVAGHVCVAHRNPIRIRGCP